MTSIRGAITVEANTSEAILDASKELLCEIIAANGSKNGLRLDQIIDITFSATKDLDAVYPAAAARAMGITEAGLFCVQEMDVSNSLPKCIRIMAHVDIPEKKQSDMVHIYLRGADVLRPDLAKKKLAVAIDGPSGAGKSTIAKEVSAAAGIIYIDTGAMYRAVALHNIIAGTDIKDKEAVEKSLNHISIDIQHDDKKKQRLILNNSDVTEDLRTQKVAEGSSIVASYPAVRQKLVTLQQDLAKKYSVVMDGRDIGTVVLPHAQVKIYLDASLKERVHRRIHELELKGEPAEYDSVLQAIESRDERDMNRTHSPLLRAKDAHYIHSDGMTINEIANEILKEIQKI
ncbi:MAG: (d)CMP kinase [Defluviitaleaceae bacterium]|nr:(d)CMP kinase [Defluviitaleaceae bacterium]